MKGIAKILLLGFSVCQLFGASFWASGVSEQKGWGPSLFQGNTNYCWLYTASALLDHWQSQSQALIKNTNAPQTRQDILANLKKEFANHTNGNFVKRGLANFFINYYPSVDYYGKIHTEIVLKNTDGYAEISKNAFNILKSGSPVGISYVIEGGGAHAITIWGAEFDENGEMIKMYATDSASSSGKLELYTKDGGKQMVQECNEDMSSCSSTFIDTKKIPTSVYVMDYLTLYTGAEMDNKTDTSGGNSGSNSGGTNNGNSSGNGNGGGNNGNSSGGSNNGANGGGSNSNTAKPNNNLNAYNVAPNQMPLLQVLLEHTSILPNDSAGLKRVLDELNSNFKRLSKTNNISKTLPLLHKQDINARIQSVKFSQARFALDETKRQIALKSGKASLDKDKDKANLANSDIFYQLYAANYLIQSDARVSANLHFDEPINRVWANAGGGYFKGDGSTLSFQNISVGYDKRAFGGDFLLGALLGLTNSTFKDEKLSQEPKIYTFSLYSNALLGFLELQNELSVSAIDGKLYFSGENGDYKGFGGYFDTLLKADFGFALHPQILARASFDSINAFESLTYKQKAHQDTAISVGFGAEYVLYKQSGFYRASFLATKDIYHSNDKFEISLSKAQNFVTYEKSVGKISYELELGGYESFANGVFIGYGVAGVFNTNFKGIKANLQAGWRF